jgi:hypothetical protein
MESNWKAYELKNLELFSYIFNVMEIVEICASGRRSD